MKLLDKFQLRFTETLNAGDDTIHVISREFNKYSHILLQFLEMYHPVYTVCCDLFALLLTTDLVILDHGLG